MAVTTVTVVLVTVESPMDITQAWTLVVSSSVIMIARGLIQAVHIMSLAFNCSALAQQRWLKPRPVPPPLKTAKTGPKSARESKLIHEPAQTLSFWVKVQWH